MTYRSTAARLSFGAFVVALCIALVASFGTRLGLWLYTTGFEILIPAVIIGALALAAGIWWLAAALRNNNSEGWRWGFAGLVGSAALLWVPLGAALQAYGAPPIHDISTDVEFAPPFEALLPLRKGSPNGPEYDGPKKVVLDGKITTVAELQKKAFPEIKAHASLVDPRSLPKGATPQSYWFWRAFERAKRMGWNVVAFDPKRGRIEATDTTLWFGFTDDIVIRVSAAGTIGARVDIRSKSRAGTFDYGRNAERVRAYLRSL
ncbi:MAG: DUF1499 domain-containing protein [Alphaproteobacteria bacterium]|nr:DUF1499 domain-containing protein [Alphaproteobacteria bacterium]MBV9694030.1 DUF1499 domain-containing protein [Alphaproteobacteria bacterium]